MEDRDTRGLWLEMTRRAPDAYVAERVPEVLAWPGVERATWWENVHFDRQDLPRVLPEFTLLGVYEVADGFAPPSTPDDVDGLHYVRTPRPGQGSLSGQPTVGLSLVLISPQDPADAQVLRDWGDFVHLRHIAQVGVPGYTMVTPYEHAERGDPRYLHFYEMDTEDAERTFKSMTPLVVDRIGGPGTPAYERWFMHPTLRIMYVNSFRRLGERVA